MLSVYVSICPAFSVLELNKLILQILPETLCESTNISYSQ